jgi:hypothetical protein
MINLGFNLTSDLLSHREGELLRTEIERWADATTKLHGDREARLLEKVEAVTGFFSVANRSPQDIRPPDIRIWRDALETQGCNASTIRDYVGFLSSFFEWLLKSSVPEFPIPPNPTKIIRRQLVKEVSANDCMERTEALIKRAQSLRVNDSLNFRDFLADDLDELEAIIQYERKQIAASADPTEVAACEEAIIELKEFGMRLKKLRIMYMVVAMRALLEINRKPGELGNWEIIIGEVRKARPSWNIPMDEDLTVQWLDKVDTLLIDSLKQRLIHVPRTRLASSPIAHEGFIRFPSERIFKATLEALMPGAMLTGPPLYAALDTLSEGRQIAENFEAAYVFKSKMGDFEGAIGFPLGTGINLRQAINDMPALAVKTLFALWARLYAETKNPNYGEVISVSVAQFCDDLGYKPKKGSHTPENRFRVITLLEALMKLEAAITYHQDKRLGCLKGSILDRRQLPPEVKGYFDIFAKRQHTEYDDSKGSGAFAYGPGQVYAGSTWRARNSNVGLISEELLNIGKGNIDKWTVLVGGYLASIGRMNRYRPKSFRAEVLVRKTGLYLERERHYQFGRMRDKFEEALARLQETGIIKEWRLTQSQLNSPETSQKVPPESGDDRAESPLWKSEWSKWQIEVSWPEALRKRLNKSARGQKRN